MSDDTEQVKGPNDYTPEERQEILSKYNSPEEEKAKANNWLPPELYGAGAVSAEVYNVKGDFIQKDMTRQKEIKSLKKQLKITHDMQKEIFEQGKKQALEELRKQKAQAINEADGDRVTEIEAQMDELNKPSQLDTILEDDSTSEDNTTTQANVSPYFQDVWLPKNTWFNQDPALADIATTLANGLAAKVHAGQAAHIKSDADFYTFIDKAMEPHLKARNMSTSNSVTPANRVSPNQGSSSKGKTFTADDLDYDQRAVGQNFVNMKLFKDLDAYAASLAKTVNAKK